MWDEFGLQANPYEIKAVEIGGVVPLSTFEGRFEDRKKLAKVIKSTTHSLNLIVGDRGVGKTSLGTIVRSDLFDDYFTALIEIDTQHNWNSMGFIEAALLSFVETAEKAKQHTDLSSKYRRICAKIAKAVDLLFFGEQVGLGGQAAGFGLNTTRGRSPQRTHYVLLKSKFAEITNLILSEGYKGVIIQYNNLDNMDIDPQKLSILFSDLRDFLVSDHVHFIILGNKLMEESVKYNGKVNECITSNIHLGALGFETIKKILENRYQTFKIRGQEPRAPVSDEGIKLLHNLYDGNIRQIFYSLYHAVLGSQEVIKKIKPLNADEVKLVLHELAKRKVETEIEGRSKEVLKLIVNSNQDITNMQITRKLKLLPSNISKYLKQLKDSNLIIQSDKIGRKIYYKAVHEAKWLLLTHEPTVQTDLTPYTY